MMMAVLLLLSLLVYFSRLPEVDADEEKLVMHDVNLDKQSVFQFPNLVLGVITLFFYVGVEVIAVDTVFGFAESQGITLRAAKFFTSLTIFNMLIGYSIGIFCIPRFIQQRQALKYSAIGGIVFFAVAISTEGILSVIFICLLGLANSLVWPSIWPLALQGLGRYTKAGSSLLIMAIGGGAILPLFYGQLAQRFNPHLAYWIVLPCYVSILYYAIWGHKAKTKLFDKV